MISVHATPTSYSSPLETYLGDNKVALFYNRINITKNIIKINDKGEAKNAVDHMIAIQDLGLMKHLAREIVFEYNLPEDIRLYIDRSTGELLSPDSEIEWDLFDLFFYIVERIGQEKIINFVTTEVHRTDPDKVFDSIVLLKCHYQNLKSKIEKVIKEEQITSTDMTLLEKYKKILEDRTKYFNNFLNKLLMYDDSNKTLQKRENEITQEKTQQDETMQTPNTFNMFKKFPHLRYPF